MKISHYVSVKLVMIAIACSFAASTPIQAQEAKRTLRWPVWADTRSSFGKAPTDTSQQYIQQKNGEKAYERCDFADSNKARGGPLHRASYIRPHNRSGWCPDLLPGGRRSECAGRSLVAWVSGIVVHVPRVDSTACRSVPRHRAGSGRLRIYRSSGTAAL